MQVQVSANWDRAEGLVAWLKENGHEAVVRRDSATLVDGDDIGFVAEARERFDELMTEYLASVTD